MISKVVYIFGIVCSILCVKDIWEKNIDPITKVILAAVVLLTSWLGIVLYYYVIRERL